MKKSYDLIIIGSGAAGLSAGIYAGRYKIKTLLIKGEKPGGETATAWTVENYPGFKSIDGFELMQKIEEHAKEAGVEIISGAVQVVKAEQGHCFALKIDNKICETKTIIIASGSTRRRLGLKKEEKFIGHGISYCAICDSPLFKNKTIGIVGGGDSSVKGAHLASQYAKKIYLIVRGDKINAEPINWERLQEKIKNEQVEILYNTEVVELMGKQMLEGVRLSKPYQNENILKIQGLFIEIGSEPNNKLAKELNVSLNERGYIKVDQMMKTSVDGVFAAGDIVDQPDGFKQIIVAASQGAIAATAAYRDLNIHGGRACFVHTKVIY